MVIIDISIKNKIATVEGKPVIVCGNTDYMARFTFDEEWQPHEAKTARFIYDGKYSDVVFTGNECNIPMLTKATGVYIGVFAGNLQTSTPAYINCDKSILCHGGTPQEPTPDVYAQLIELINSGAIKGETGEKGDTPQKGIDYWTEADKAEIIVDLEAYTDEKIEALRNDLLEGQPIYVEDKAEKMIKQIPSGAFPFAYINKIGGKTEKVTEDGEKLVSSPVTSIITQGRNLVNDVEFYLSNGFIKQSNGYWKGSQVQYRIWVNKYNIQGVISVSLDVKILTGISGNSSPLNIIFYYTDGTSQGYQIINTEYTQKTYSSKKDKTVTRVMWTYVTNGTYEVKDLMINVGEEPLPYEKYTFAERNIPTAITSRNGYGDSGNIMDFADMKFYRNFKRIAFTGGESWILNGGCNNGFLYCVALPTNFKAVKDVTHFTRSDGEEIYIGDYSIIGKALYICTESATLEELKAELSALNESGAPLTMLYELTESEIEDISAESDINPITVYGGGMLILCNEKNVNIPNTVEYIKRGK